MTSNEIKIIGITGNIGTGKSEVSKILTELGYTVIDADNVARLVVQRGQPALSELKEEFGRGILQTDGSLNRKVLAEFAFKDKRSVRELNRIMHRYICAYIEERIENQILFLKNAEEPLPTLKTIFIDAPLLIETGLHKSCDEIWLVTASMDNKIGRVMSRSGLTEEQVKKRLSAQLPDNQKRWRTKIDVTIENDGSLDDLEKKVKEILNGKR
jgi:dephospho-CoA kinase